MQHCGKSVITLTMHRDYNHICGNDYVLSSPETVSASTRKRPLSLHFHSITLYSTLRVELSPDLRLWHRSTPKVNDMAGAGTPVYKQIQSGIRKRIQTSELKPGDAVTSERELARTYGVSLMTARHALAGLEH